MGDGGHTKGAKKLPDALRYSPPQLSKYNPKDDHLEHNSPKSHHDSAIKSHHDNGNKSHHDSAIKSHHDSAIKSHHDSDIKNHHDNHSNHHDSAVRNHNDNHSSHHDSPISYHDNHSSHNNNNGKHMANGNSHTPPHKYDSNPAHKKETTPPHSVHHPHSPPGSHHEKTPPHANGTHPPHNNNLHHNGSINNGHHPHPPGGAPVKKSKEIHRTESERRRAYDDYELDRRKQQMDRQGWPARDTKDYLIGGIYGPQPKSKLPNDAHQPPTRQNHTNGNDHHHQETHPVTRLTHPQPPSTYQPPSHAANRAQVRRQKAAGAAKEPYRSRSFPREDRNRLNKKPVVGQKNDPRSHSLMDLKGPAQPAVPSKSRNQNRGVMDTDEFSLINEDDEDFVIEPPIPGRRRKAGAQKANRYDGFIGPSEFVNNDTNKAKVCMFYKNGDPFFPGVKVSLRPGRDFASFEALCNHLTPRTDLPIGVRYIFTMDGDKLRDLDEFEDGGMYVCSSRKKFVPLEYKTGQLGWKPHSKLKMDEELKLFRPPSITGPAGNSSDGQQQPGSRGKRLLRIINNDKQSLQVNQFKKYILLLSMTQIHLPPFVYKFNPKKNFF